MKKLDKHEKKETKAYERKEEKGAKMQVKKRKKVNKGMNEWK